MAGVLDSVNQRTQLVGQNRLELLLFRLRGKQLYGINVFKVREVINCPRLTNVPKSHAVIRGIAHSRDKTIPIIDLGLAIGMPPIKDVENCFTIITEYNIAVQGFLVSSVERIVNMNWSKIQPPPAGAGSSSYLTAVTEVDKQLVEIIDVEKVLSEVSPQSFELSSDVISKANETEATSDKPKRILVADDSAVARNQIKRCMEQIGIEVITMRDGLEALKLLQKMADEGKNISDEFLLMISDIEMPEMDGYTLTTEVRNDNRMADLYIILHTSLSGVFNKAMVEKVGADDFIAKFQPDILAASVQKIMES